MLIALGLLLSPELGMTLVPFGRVCFLVLELEKVLSISLDPRDSGLPSILLANLHLQVILDPPQAPEPYSMPSWLLFLTLVA